MKVMCINNKPLPNMSNQLIELLKEGEEYTVIGICESEDLTGNEVDGYVLKELKKSQDKLNIAFHASRFIPLSTIDETELAEKRQFEHV